MALANFTPFSVAVREEVLTLSVRLTRRVMSIPLRIKNTYCKSQYKEMAERQAANRAQTDTRGGYRDIMYR